MTTATVGSARAAERPVANRRIAVVVGVLFLSATVAFAIGNSLIRSYFSGATSSGGTLVIGVLLLGCSALADVAMSFAMRRVLMPHAPLRSQAYFVLRLAECVVVVAVGVYFLASRDNWSAYALAVYVPSGLAGLVLSSALLTSRLVPRGLFELALPVRLILRGFDRV